MEPEVMEKLKRLREPFAAEQIGKLPRTTCSDCSKKNCQKHKRQNCNVCGNYISTQHIHLDYVGHAAVTDRLLEVDPGWYWEPMAVDPNTGGPLLSNNGTVLWIKLTVLGVTRIGVGSVAGGSFEAEKQLIGDALRNAAMRFGVALDLWSKEDLHAAEPPAPPEATVDLTHEVTDVDDAGAPRFSDNEKKAIKAEWKKRRFGFKLSEVPESRVDEIKVFIASFEGTDVPAEPEGNAQERSDEGAAAIDLPGYEAPLSETEAKDKIAGCFAKLLPKQQDQRREAFDIWQESGYEGIGTVGAVEWGILMQFARERIEQLMKEKAA